MVYGRFVDRRNRCVHDHGPWAIVAIRFPCCGKYDACFECHRDLAAHGPARWRRGAFGGRAVRCGACGGGLTVWEYLRCGDRCLRCGARFNPWCRRHRHLYFEGSPHPSPP